MSVQTLSLSTPTARKQHACDLCGRRIQPGEKYERAASIYDGRLYTWRQCSHCDALTSIFESDQLYWDDEGCGPDTIYNYEPRDVAELRLKVLWKMRWTRPNGALFPVPTRTP